MVSGVGTNQPSKGREGPGEESVPRWGLLPAALAAQRSPAWVPEEDQGLAWGQVNLQDGSQHPYA